VLPRVESRDAFWAMKHAKEPRRDSEYEAIEVPRNSANGFVTAFFAVVTGFALIWHIWWMALLGLVCALATLLVFAWVPRTEIVISAESLATAERARSARAPGTA
jgi:cytochrome o ubiquinol oxidase subunit 1